MPDSTAVTYIRAVNRALQWCLESDESAVIIGEDVAKPNGPFGATKGLHDAYPGRIWDTPISEAGFLGMCLGAAMRGLRPIAEIMFMDFTLVAMDQIVNQIANTRYVSEGRFGAPLVIRTQQGTSPGSCAQHSQCLESFFAHVPGLRVGLPASPDDAYQIIRAAFQSDDPVMVIESRMLYPTKGEARLDAPVERVGSARILRTGEDITVVAWSSAVQLALSAAQELDAEHGIDAEVIDLRWLNPLDIDTVTASVDKTRRAVIVHEANLTGGFGAEIAARVNASCFSTLAAPVARVGARDTRIPAAPVLQEYVLPQVSDVVTAAHSTFEALHSPRAKVRG